MTDKVVHKDLSYQIVGALFHVYNEIGYGHKEKVYQKAVATCLKQAGLSFQEQVKADLTIGSEKIGFYYLDFLIDGKVILELKAQVGFRAADYRQCHSYLKTTGYTLAILATFAPDGVRYRRVLNAY